MLSRQFTKTFLRLVVSQARYLPKVPVYNFNTTPGKKILDVWDINKALYLELSDAIGGAYTCKQLAELLKENVHQMTDYQLSYAIYRIYNDEIPLDDHFYNVILPIVKEFVKNFDRNNNRALYQLIQHLGWLRVKDEGLWNLFEQKLLDEKLYRYIPTNELCKVAHALAEAGQGSKELFNAFERVFIKHRLNLGEEDIGFAREAFETRKFGSQLLFEVFRDPERNIQAIAAQQGEKPEHLKIGHH